MGGNALKHKGSVRCNRAVYEQTLNTFLIYFDELRKHFSLDCRVFPTRSYREKQDFGDIDLLVESTLFQALSRDEIVDFLTEIYSCALPFVSNEPVLSIGLPLEKKGEFLQLDMIKCPSDEIEFSYEYFSWNDAGNLIGRVAYKMGLRFGHNGLWLPLRDGNNLFATLLVSREIDIVLDFLGFDPTRWHEGFDSLEDIFQFIASGKRFNADIFRLENRNHTARVRDRKRPTYNAFLAWIDRQESLPAFEFNSDKGVYLDEIFSSFPNVSVPYWQAVEQLEKKKALKSIFNGELVSDWTGLSGEELGVFMKSFKEAQPDMQNDELTQDDVRDMVLLHKESFK